MTKETTFPILLPSHCVTEKSSLSDVAWNLGCYLGDLEKTGVGWHQFPDEIREIGTLNTACGGLKGNGSRTSLRNLVVLEGIDFTRAFLNSAVKGAHRLGWKMHRNPFEAELEWLDFVGKCAAKLLDDGSRNFQLLNGAESLFFGALNIDEYRRKELLEPLDPGLRQRFECAEKNERGKGDNHNSRVFLYVMQHPGLEIVPLDDSAEDFRSDWMKRVEECAAKIKAQSTLLDRMPIVNRFLKPRKLH